MDDWRESETIMASKPAETGFAGTRWASASAFGCREIPGLPAFGHRQARQYLADLLLGNARIPMAVTGGDSGTAASATPPVEIIATPLGRPRLLVEGKDGPSISFAHLEGMTWAAVTTGKGTVGIDVARAKEFGEGYPFDRAFHPDEWHAFEHWCQTPERVAAALWSAKEAVVKALGCGFHFFGPLDLMLDTRRDVTPCKPMNMVLSARAFRRLPCFRNPNVPVSTRQQGSCFLSVALTDPEDKGR